MPERERRNISEQDPDEMARADEDMVGTGDEEEFEDDESSDEEDVEDLENR